MVHMRLIPLYVSLFSLSLLSGFFSLAYGNPLIQRYDEIARRTERDTELFRRESGRMTFYNVETGLPGSCGRFLLNSELVVAVNAAEMNSDLCFKNITISFNGISVGATIQDTCPSCPPGGLDLSEGLFSIFLPLSSGLFIGDWELADE